MRASALGHCCLAKQRRLMWSCGGAGSHVHDVPKGVCRLWPRGNDFLCLLARTCCQPTVFPPVSPMQRLCFGHLPRHMLEATQAHIRRDFNSSELVVEPLAEPFTGNDLFLSARAPNMGHLESS